MNQSKVMRLDLGHQFPARWLWIRRLIVRRLARSFECYHPVFLGQNQLSAGQRACMDRWQMIRQVLASDHIENLLDVGCAEGFFVQHAALEHGILSLGIDADVRRLTIANETCLLNGVPNCGFMYAQVSPAFLKQLPTFDVVLFLSVLHHVMYEHGVDYARAIMSSIRQKTKKFLIFDMGQSNELEHSWSKKLPQMNPDPATWISSFLQQCGFSDVQILGETDAYQGATRRIVFVAKP